MLTNLNLKLKVFFLMSVVIAALSIVNFILFKNFINKIDVQQGAKNSVKLVEEELKNANYLLIGNSFSIAKQLKFVAKTSKDAAVLTTEEIKSDIPYVVVNQDGDFVAGKLRLLNSYAGIPAVERALKDGVASDGMLFLNNNLYLIGVVPTFVFKPDDTKMLFAVITLQKMADVFNVDIFPMPVKVFRGTKLIAGTKDAKWAEVGDSYGDEKLNADIQNLISSQGQKELNKWTRISSFFMPYDLQNGEKITVVTMTSSIPSWESYNKVLIYLTAYAIAAVFIALLFTFITVHEVDKTLKNLASDISRMKIGEKLVLKKYSYGADVAVSALNTLVSKYLKHYENENMIASKLINATDEIIQMKPENFVDPFMPETQEIKVENAEDKKLKRVKKSGGSRSSTSSDLQSKAKTQPKPVQPKPVQPKPVQPKPVQPKPAQPKPEFQPKPESLTSFSDADLEDDDNEKTQIAEIFNPSPKMNYLDALFEDYCRIKRKHGGTVSNSEKSHFIGKVKTNRASIMAKYKCSDVQFSIEEKNGQPIIKAKPING